MWTAEELESFYIIVNILANFNPIVMKLNIYMPEILTLLLTLFSVESHGVVINYTLFNYLNYKNLHKNEITIFFNSQKSTQQYGLKSVHLDVYLSYGHRRWNNSFKDTLSNISIQGTIGIVKTVHPIVCTTM